MDMEGERRITPNLNNLNSITQQSTIVADQKQEEERFFLYTKLNQNETKSLRKAGTNTEERR